MACCICWAWITKKTAGKWRAPKRSGERRLDCRPASSKEDAHDLVCGSRDHPLRHPALSDHRGTNSIHGFVAIARARSAGPAVLQGNAEERIGLETETGAL